MATAAGAEPGGNHKPGISSRSPTEVAVAQGLGSSSDAFPGTLVRELDLQLSSRDLNQCLFGDAGVTDRGFICYATTPNSFMTDYDFIAIIMQT